MSYSLFIKKNIILNSSEVQLPAHIQAVMPDSDSITISKTFVELCGYDVAEAFDAYRPDGFNEINIDDLKEFLGQVEPEFAEDPLLENESSDWVFFTYFESY